MRRTLLAAALTALVAGCGSQPPSTGVASVSATSAAPSAAASPTGTADPEEQARKYARCMRENGVDMPDPEPGGAFRVMTKVEAGTETFKKAMEACRELAPFKDRGELTPEDEEKMRAFARCMRENGVDMPDPEPGGGLRVKSDGRVDPDDPAFKAAMDTCRSQMPRLGNRK
ncbi:hypothetical protein [Nonomuraea sp. SBT364]|uniref:hypothetical protein n=1 Tax=Nonomuraea sp. SBT364 TaxID=1580530 RepID=UPI0007C7C566|nr:hypothetical protein [Nonomuraea sp. SBT364]